MLPQGSNPSPSVACWLCEDSLIRRLLGVGLLRGGRRGGCAGRHRAAIVVPGLLAGEAADATTATIALVGGEHKIGNCAVVPRRVFNFFYYYYSIYLFVFIDKNLQYFTVIYSINQLRKGLVED
jgi:hypothetical protein